MKRNEVAATIRSNGALYQGTTSVVPKKSIKMSWASAPATVRQTILILCQKFLRSR